MIYKLRKEINVTDLSLTWLMENPHAGTTRLVDENWDNYEMDDFYEMLQYPKFIELIITRLSILSSHYLSKNPDAIHILTKNPDLIDWAMLSTNPSSKALEIIEENIINEYIGTTKQLDVKCSRTYSNYPAFWRLLATNTNPKAVELIEKYYYKINPLFLDQESIDFWHDLSKNPNAIHLLEKYPRYIDWTTILENPNAVPIIEKNLDKIHNDDWIILSGNLNAVHIFEKPEYLNKLYDWSYLSKNPKAMHIIVNNWDKVDWITFSQNPSAINMIIQLLQEQKDYHTKNMKNIEIKIKINIYNYFPNNLENDLNDEKNHNIYRSLYKYYDYFYKIDYPSLSKNPAIFELDYQGLKKRCDIYRKELIEKTMHPSRMIALLEKGFDLDNLEDYF